MLVAKRKERLHVEPQSLRRIRDPGQRARARNVTRGKLVVHLRPADPLALAADQAEDIETPIAVCDVVGDAAKRDRDLRNPSVGDQPAVRVPDRVPLGQKIGVVLQQAVEARAQRIDLEDVSVAPCLVGIEVDPNQIVLAHVSVARLHCRLDRARLAVERVDREIEVVLVVEHAHFQALARRRAFLGLELIKFVDHPRLRPHRVRNVAVKLGRLAGLDPRGDRARLIGRKVPRGCARRVVRRSRRNCAAERDQRSRERFPPMSAHYPPANPMRFREHECGDTLPLKAGEMVHDRVRRPRAHCSKRRPGNSHRFTVRLNQLQVATPRG